MTGRELPPRVEASSASLVGTLAVAGALAGLAIVLVFQWANPQIEAYRAKVLAEAVTEVLAGAERYETVFFENGSLSAVPTDTAGLDRVFVGYDASGRRVGVAMQAGEPGFQDVISVIFGYDPGTGLLLGMKVLEHKETPGLGDKIERDSAFIGAFGGVASPIVGVQKARATGAKEEIVMITGATISSRAVIDIINHRLEELRGPIESYWRTTTTVDEARQSDSTAPRDGRRQPDVAALGSDSRQPDAATLRGVAHQPDAVAPAGGVS